MSDPINANPTVLDVSQLPSRVTFDKSVNGGNVAAIFQDDDLRDLLSLSLFNGNDDMKEFRVDPDGDVLSMSDPEILSVASSVDGSSSEGENDEDEPIDAQEIFDLVSTISDPEHPLTLGQLAVISLADIKVLNKKAKSEISEVIIKITPTITHCSLATLIGLGIRVRLERCLPPRFRITILVKEGTHQSENQVNKQLNDKERVAAACENEQLLGVISQMLSTCK
ncbi:hypothetical protein PACTADRAFT_49126 [Pachysolen tannophilus NRRL Y-2460]|uniref:Uncharacterized protein n=1 Tax=Pachysolen tannophilus NRRL Y-2460 TaxID=669874 RepID=A0A1E4U091_PACTA|nr:hypothetical protein PACTADRAFT_49126 [Pachysolen tannophilus NRRL Y-2460]